MSLAWASPLLSTASFSQIYTRTGLFMMLKVGLIKMIIYVQFLCSFTRLIRKMFCLCTERINKTVAITKQSVEVVEKGVKLRLNIVDTPGFGDALDNTNR